MLIVCPNCETSYQIKAQALGTGGRSVRCAQCKETWFATPESAIVETAMALAMVPNRAPEPPAPPPPDDLLTGNNFSVDAVIPPGEKIEGEPVLVAEAPPLVPQSPVEAPVDVFPPKFEPGTPDDADTMAAKRIRQKIADRKNKPSLAKRLVSLPMLIVVMLAIVLGALNWRAAVVRYFPQTGSLFAAIGLPVNLRGLTFEGVKSTSEVHDGVTVLAIEGTIINLTRHTLDVPKLRFALRNPAGHEVYAWTAPPPKATVGSGNGLQFRARLASPPADGRDVIVRFFNRRDVGAGS